MKRTLFLTSVLIMVIGCLASSCGKPENPVDPGTIDKPSVPSEPEIPSEPEMSPDSVIVTLGAHLDFTSEPLSKGTKAGSLNDLYDIRVYQLHEIGEPYGDDEMWGSCASQLVARGTFDDLGLVNIKMSKRYLHQIQVIYVPDGKTKVWNREGWYGIPFANLDPVNQLTYDPYEPITDDVGRFGCVASAESTGSTLVRENEWSSVPRYQGASFIDPSCMTEVDVTLYSTMIGFRIDISEFERGSVTLQGIYAEGNSYTAVPDEGMHGLIDVEVNMNNVPWAAPAVKYYKYKSLEENQKLFISENLKGESLEDVKIRYTDGDNTSVMLFHKQIRAIANTRYCMSFSLSDAIRNGSVTASMAEEGEMNEVNLLD